jgi:hypothetical protein
MYSRKEAYVFDPVRWTHRKWVNWQMVEIFMCFLELLTGVVVCMIFAWPLFSGGFLVLLYTSPLWITYKLPQTFWYYWIHYRNHVFLSKPNQEPVLLEIKIPKGIQRSPRAMEIVFENMWIKPSTTTKFQRDWRGNVRPWWSFEIVSDGGEIHFYVWTWKRFRNRVQSVFYSQFPEIQLIETEDYSKRFNYVPGGDYMWGGNNYILMKENAYPIKTYFDYELHKDPKIEHKVDPLATALDMIGTARKGEKYWIQFIIQQAVDHRTWKKKVQEAVEKIYEEARIDFPDPSDPDKLTKGSAILRPMQYEFVKAMQRSTTKNVFDVGIRALYIAPNEMFDIVRLHMIVNYFGIFNPGHYGGGFDKAYYNTFAGDGEKYTANFDFPWEDFKDIRFKRQQRMVLDAYQQRSFFHHPYIDHPIMLNSEMLATLFHFPSDDAKVPGLERLESKRGNAPVDLPV